MAGGNKGNGVQAKLKGDIISFPVYIASAIYRGTMVMVGSDGYARQGADTSGAFFVGIAEEDIAAADAVASGTVSVRVRRRGIFKMTLNTGAAQPSLNGELVYIHTAQTSAVDELVGLKGACTNDVLVGQVVRHGTAVMTATASTTEVWVDISMAILANSDVTTHSALTGASAHFGTLTDYSAADPTILAAAVEKGLVTWSYAGASTAAGGTLPATGVTVGQVFRIVKTGTAGPFIVGATALVGLQCLSNKFYGLYAPGDSVTIMNVGADSYRVIGVNQRRPLVTVVDTTEADAAINVAVAENAILKGNHATVAIVVTLPAAATGNTGASILIAQTGAAAVTVICAAGFGGGGGSYDTVTLALGMMCECFSDGAEWFVSNFTAAAGS